MRVLCLLGLLAFAMIGANWAAEQSADDPPVYGIHELKLRDGASAEEFEKFVKGEFSQAFREKVAGVRLIVLKGDRGKHVGDYRLIFYIESKSLRDKYFPDGQASDEVKKELASVLGQMQKLATYVSREEFTDYVALN